SYILSLINFVACLVMKTDRPLFDRLKHHIFMWCFSPASFLATQAGISGQNRFFVESFAAQRFRKKG
ncbi:hypothetical protein, partial [Flintibacter muris]|uniref:hypothetical protein n=1 Tax=Flintibacter muris TaxID=2941327 RepID=UPI00203B9BA2